MIVLSILICSLESRKHLLEELLIELRKQRSSLVREEDVEIISYVDNKQKTTGFKRQYLLEKSRGEYVVFIDDDDSVSYHYIASMIEACRSGCDCIAINGTYTTDGHSEIRWELSKDNENENVIGVDGKPLFLRRTNHITAVKRTLALAAGFPDYSNGEDKYYSERLHLRTEYKIERPMYHYRFSTQNKEY